MPRVLVSTMLMDPTQFHGSAVVAGSSFAAGLQAADNAMDLLPGAPIAAKFFMGPEYYFSTMNMAASNQNKTISPLTRTQKHSIYGDLKTLSTQYHDIVIIGGTILYAKGHGNIFSKRRGLNVSPIFLNGIMLHKHYKTFDDGHLNKAEPNATYTHKHTDPYFQVNGISVGFEICGEHNQNVLQTWSQIHNKPQVDLHVIVAAGTTIFNSKINAKPAGYVILCEICRIVKVRHPGPGQQLVAPVHTSAALIDGSVVQVYDLNV